MWRYGRRDEIHVRGKVEYMIGSGIEVSRTKNGYVILKGVKGKKGAVAVWKGGGYVVWVWNGKEWFKYVDVRYKEMSLRRVAEVEMSVM